MEQTAKLERIINGTTSGKVGRKPKLTSEQKQNVIKKHSSGISYSKLTEEYSVSKSTICNICKGCQNNQMIIDVMVVGKQTEKSMP
ncbi:MAG: Hin recombinase [Lachnospiraceae bacterium]|nr:Hin recombinase [Lachnospiraceae bacterium]